MVFDVQLILWFHLHSQGIPKMICCCSRLRTMVPLMFAVPSTLYVWMGLGRHCKGKFTLDRRPILMKFLVAPQSMRAVVLMICVPVASLMGK